ncbi:MAG: sulfotransferase [Actinomycetota bacterium]|nr:sulfotransferase [Actinomycetota bacterium]
MRIFVLGMHRSGTSLMVRTLEAMGFWAGAEADFHPPTAHDPQGHREHVAVHALDETALKWIDRSWEEPVGIDWARLTPARRADLLGAMRTVVEQLDAHPDWVAKDPRLCLTLPLWRDVVEPACIFMHRNPLEVARSLAARDGMPLFAGIAMWEAYSRAGLGNSHGLARLIIDHGDLIREPAATTQQLEHWWRDQRATTPAGGAAPEPTPALVRQRAAAVEAERMLNPAQQRLLAAIQLACAGGDEGAAALADAMAEPLSEQAEEIVTVLAAHRRRLEAMHERDIKISRYNEQLRQRVGDEP